MHHFAVWAPRAKSCVVEVQNIRHPMAQGEHGWWQADVADAHHGSDYAFFLDDDPKPYPDPRSAWQPDGVHGRSRILDHSEFAWHDENWTAPLLSEAIVYELHVGTFTPEGTYRSAIQRLQYLRELGITHVELMPVNSFPGRWGWGYDGVALYAPQEQYGGPEALKAFVDACHTTGLAVLLDVVYNHFGPDGNYTGRFGPYITENHHTPWGGAINFEESGSDEVRRFFCDNALMWLRDYHFDGLRLDAIHAFIDRSAKHFLEQLSEEVETLSVQSKKIYVLIAESDLNDPRVVTPRRSHEPNPTLDAGGYGIDAQWSDDFHHAIFALLTGERRSYYKDFGSLAQLAKSLKSVYVYDGIYSEYRGCIHGRPVEHLSAHRFLGYIQNHDQVGNRAFGDRISSIVGLQKAKLAAALVMTAPFVPMLFQGEEFAASAPFLYFADHDDPELARAVSEGRRREHAHDGAWDSIPDPESLESFNQSKLNWNELNDPEHAEMLDWHRKLIQLRRSQPSLMSGDRAEIQVEFDEALGWMSMQRGSIRLFYNFGESSASWELTPDSRLHLTSDTAVQVRSQKITVPAFAFAAVSVK
jgi:maltooligosyltrehalose trehalohydrolase